MEDGNLFFIDTQRSTDIQCTTATTAREFTVTAPKPERRRGPKAQTVQSTITTINDDIIATTPTTNGASASARAAGAKRSKGAAKKGKQRANNGLDSQFLQLEISENPAETTRRARRKKTRNRYKAAEKQDKKGNNSGSTRKERRAPPPKQEDDSEVEASIADFVANLGEEEFEEIISMATENGFMEREIGGGLDYNYAGRSKKPQRNDMISYVNEDDDEYDSDGMFRVENALEDDMESMDEMLRDSEDEIHTDGGFDEDDGIPCSIDPETLGGPSGGRSDWQQKGNHVDRSQNKKKPRKGDQAKRNGGRPKDKANGNREGPTPGFDPYKVLKRLDMLARSEELSSLWMEPMNKHERQIVHIFAREYGIKSKSHGGGTRRAPVLTTTPNTRIPRNRKRINKVLLLFDNDDLEPEMFIGGRNNQGGSSSGGGKGKRQGEGRGGGVDKAIHGKMVAENAPAVGASNIGHKMLEQMGWQPGRGLGVQEEGRATPVDVMIRGGRRGLGA
ncbi:squalene synthetase-like protein [Coemansia sp. BCRC 34490]|nr:squalene synthetase-like protein [Coemansia sp. BCRC 34490]